VPSLPIMARSPQWAPGSGGGKAASALAMSLLAEEGRASPGLASISGGLEGDTPATISKGSNAGSLRRMNSKVAAEEGCRAEKHWPLFQNAHGQHTQLLGRQVPIRVLPSILCSSAASSAVSAHCLQLPMLDDLVGARCLVTHWLFGLIHGTALVCMMYCMLCDPGQVEPELLSSDAPRRSHKAWTHPRPIRRYDHYCRWLMNSVGLLNHREFVLMLWGLVAGGALGALLLDVRAETGIASDIASTRHPGPRTLLEAHMLASGALGWCAYRILEIHLGFIHRNELCAEWKDDSFYKVGLTTKLDHVNVPRRHAWFGGKRSKTSPMLVEDLPRNEQKRIVGKLAGELKVEDYNRLDIHTFVYDPACNLFDRGWRQNWFGFWCASRWHPHATGEF